MNIWEKLANENPEYYIWTHKGIDYSTKEGQAYFLASGQQEVEGQLQKVDKLLGARNCAIEIGCGLGRLTFPYSQIFQQVLAIDISPKMLTELNQRALAADISNVRTITPNEDWQIEEQADYVYSFYVFQHIDNWQVICEYVRKISKALKTGGVAQLHFDTRPEDPLYSLKLLLPDFLLPTTQKRGIRRIRRKANLLRQLFSESKLSIQQELQKDSASHLFILQKS
jgi:cyclopropane fatty-acyl-phospholipid synthase-like methyltransferase